MSEETPSITTMSPRNAARRLLLGVEVAKGPPSKRITIPVTDASVGRVVNVEVDVRTPTYDTLREVGRLAKGDNVKHDIIAAVMCTYLPGTNDRVLEMADVDALSATSLGGFVNALVLAVKELVVKSQEDAESYAKK
jgi:hypothetical protein